MILVFNGIEFKLFIELDNLQIEAIYFKCSFQQATIIIMFNPPPLSYYVNKLAIKILLN